MENKSLFTLFRLMELYSTSIKRRIKYDYPTYTKWEKRLTRFIKGPNLMLEQGYSSTVNNKCLCQTKGSKAWCLRVLEIRFYCNFFDTLYFFSKKCKYELKVFFLVI